MRIARIIEKNTIPLQSNTKINQDVMELCVISPRMTVTVVKRGVIGNGLVKVKWGCCRGRNRVNQGGEDCPERYNRMLWRDPPHLVMVSLLPYQEDGMVQAWVAHFVTPLKRR